MTPTFFWKDNFLFHFSIDCEKMKKKIIVGSLKFFYFSTCMTSNPANLWMSEFANAVVLRPPQTRKHCCGNTVAETLFPRRANGETFVEKTKCF